jgi:MFS family permease
LVFALSSLACAVAPNVGTLVAARIVQGAGGAAMFATTVALLNLAYPGRDRGVAFGVWGAVSGAAAAVAPILGGLLTEHLSWRWIFLVNLPVTAVAVGFTLRGVVESRRPDAPRPDLAGLVTFTAGTAAMVYGLIRATGHGWTSAGTLGMFALGLAALVAFVLVERAVRHPMLDLVLFRRPAFGGVMVCAMLLQGAAFAYLPYTSLWLQDALGKGPVGTGLTVLPLACAAFVVAAGLGRVLHGVPPRLVLAGSLLLIGAGDVLQALVRNGSAGTVLIPGLIVAGLGVGAGTPVLASAALAAAPRDRAGMAGGAVNTFRQVGYAVGVAGFGAVFQGRAAAGPGSALGTTVLVAGLVGLAGAALAAVLLRPDRVASPEREPVMAAK